MNPRNVARRRFDGLAEWQYRVLVREEETRHRNGVPLTPLQLELIESLRATAFSQALENGRDRGPEKDRPEGSSHDLLDPEQLAAHLGVATARAARRIAANAGVEPTVRGERGRGRRHQYARADVPRIVEFRERRRRA